MSVFVDYFNIYTREAGPGTLSVAFEGPSKAAIDIQENPNGYTMVSYQVAKEGERNCIVLDLSICEALIIVG